MNIFIKHLAYILILLHSAIIWAGDVTIPHSFTSGTKAVASEVNANFSAIEAEVDDNAANINTNSTAITNNSNNINTNTADIATNKADITANTGDIASNLSDINAVRAEYIEFVCAARYGVYHNNRCYYLDGSGGACDAGFQLAPQSILTSIAANFAGRDNKNTVSSNCCIEHSESATEGQDWGMASNCNAAGPFTNGPTLGGAGCTDANQHTTNQLTLCVSYH